MCDQSHGPACFPGPPAPGRAWKAMSLGHGAGSHWKPSGDWAPWAEPGSSECSFACLRLRSLGEGPWGRPTAQVSPLETGIPSLETWGSRWSKQGLLRVRLMKDS